jgi:mono/diheme cytochrome c family protein
VKLFSPRNLKAAVVVAVVGASFLWVVSAPKPLSASVIPDHTADLANGKNLYNAGGCFSCHKPTADAATLNPDLPSGGSPLKTPIGILYPPNLTPDPETGLGKWTDIEFVNAMQRGISRDGKHLIPAFPYTSYAKMQITDILDIKAYLATLKPVASPTHAAAIPVAFVVRRGLGLWDYIGLNTDPWKPDPTQSELWNRGSYLVNGPGHCGECHTPRNIFMAKDANRLFYGGPHPEGTGKVPSLHGLIERERYKDKADLVTALQNGETLGYEHLAAGGMGSVQTNISKLPQGDVEAIVEFLVSLK